MRIIGIDPGSRCTGVGIIDTDARGRMQPVFHTALKVGQEATFPLRLKRIFDELGTVIETYAPTVAGVERVFVAHNVDSALKLGQARGAAICALSCHALTVHEYAATEVKQAVVGKGRAAKEQVQHMVALLLGLDLPLQADAADALAIAITHAHMQRGRERLQMGQMTWSRRR